MIELLVPLLKTYLPLIGNVLKPLAKSVLIPLGITEAASGTNAAIHKKMFESGARPLDLAKQTALMISNKEMDDIMKIVSWRLVKYLLESLFLKVFWVIWFINKRC